MPDVLLPQGSPDSARTKTAGYAYARWRDPGAALKRAGAAFGRAAEYMQERQHARDEARRREELANLLARADPTPVLISAQERARPDGSDLYARVQDGLESWVSERIEPITDETVKLKFRERLMQRVPAVLGRAAVLAHQQSLTYSREQAEHSLEILYNRVRLNPDDYEVAVEDGLAVLATQPGMDTPGVQRTFQSRLAQGRFKARLAQATGRDEIDLVRAELAEDRWLTALGSRAYNDLLQDVSVLRNRLRQRAVTRARTKVSSLEALTEDLHAVPDADLARVQSFVTAAGDVDLQDRFLRIARNQQLLSRHRAASGAELRSQAGRLRGEIQTEARIHPQVVEATTTAAAAVGGRVSAAFLMQLARMEAGNEILKQQPNFGVQAKTSSARGIFQFTEETWLRTLRELGPDVQPDIAAMSDAEVLTLRDDPVLSAQAAAVLTDRNQALFTQRMNRAPSDLERYFAHFFGVQGAIDFVRQFERDENVAANTLFPSRVVDANRPVFFAAGQPRSVEEVYDYFSDRFSSPFRTRSGDADFLDRLAGHTERRINQNMVGYAREIGLAEIPPLEEAGGFATRREALQIISSVWDVPADELKPLEPQEVSAFRHRLTTQDPDERLQAMADLSLLGPELAQRAYVQIGAEGQVYAHGAGLLALDQASPAAYDLVRGQDFLDRNPTYLKSVGVSYQDAVEAYGSLVGEYVGNAGSDPAGGVWETVMRASFAHFVQTHVRQGGSLSRRASISPARPACRPGSSRSRGCSRSIRLSRCKPCFRSSSAHAASSLYLS